MNHNGDNRIGNKSNSNDYVSIRLGLVKQIVDIFPAVTELCDTPPSQIHGHGGNDGSKRNNHKGGVVNGKKRDNRMVDGDNNASVVGAMCDKRCEGDKLMWKCVFSNLPVIMYAALHCDHLSILQAIISRCYL
jgi:hypothetical protein